VEDPAIATTWRAAAPSSLEGRRGRWPVGFASSLPGPRGVRAPRPRKCSKVAPLPARRSPGKPRPVRAPLPGARTLHQASAAPGATSSSKRLGKGGVRHPRRRPQALLVRNSSSRLHAGLPLVSWSHVDAPAGHAPDPSARPGGLTSARPVAPVVPGRWPASLKRKSSSRRAVPPNDGALVRALPVRRPARRVTGSPSPSFSTPTSGLTLPWTASLPSRCTAAFGDTCRARFHRRDKDWASSPSPRSPSSSSSWTPSTGRSPCSSPKPPEPIVGRRIAGPGETCSRIVAERALGTSFGGVAVKKPRRAEA
jgi:hypothetical protein